MIMINSNTDMIYQTLKGLTNGKTESRQELHSTADLENIRRPATTRHLKIQRDIEIFANVTTRHLKNEIFES